jgi:hypothetical protein
VSLRETQVRSEVRASKESETDQGRGSEGLCGAIARERKERDEMRVRFNVAGARSRIREMRNRDRKIIIKWLKYERVTE